MCPVCVLCVWNCFFFLIKNSVTIQLNSLVRMHLKKKKNKKKKQKFHVNHELRVLGAACRCVM